MSPTSIAPELAEMDKAERATKMMEFITAQVNAGRTVQLATSLRVTVIKREHLELVRVRNGVLEVLCGKQGWLDYTDTRLSAR
jgi:hypothetical protein